MKGKTNIDQSEPTGAFVGAESVQNIGGEPARKSKGPQRAKGGNFMAEGQSQATSIKAARIPTHWRRGGFVQRKQEGGEVRSESTEFAKARDKADRGTGGKDWEGQKRNLEDFARTRRETGYRRGGKTGK